MLIKSVNFITSAPGLRDCPPGGWPEVAFAGRSNVGKSSLINCLLNRKGLVRTSSTPGRTQLLNFFAVNDTVYFVDLPGYGFARAPRSVRRQWLPMVHGYLKGRSSLRAVVWLLDVRHNPSKEDLEFLDWLEEFEVPTIPVITKVDKVSRNELGRRVKAISEATGLSEEFFTPFSVKNNTGHNALWELIDMVIEPADSPEEGA